MPTRQSIHCVPLMPSPIELGELYRTSYQTLQTANALKNSMYPSPTFSAGACSPMMDWMD